MAPEETPKATEPMSVSYWTFPGSHLGGLLVPRSARRCSVLTAGDSPGTTIRAVRQDARKEIAARGRGPERVVQEATNAAVAEVERLVKEKTQELGA